MADITDFIPDWLISLFGSDESEDDRVAEQEAETRAAQAAKERAERDARNKADQKEYFDGLLNRCMSAVTKTLRELPQGSRIFFDTNLAMDIETDFAISIWFDYLKRNVLAKNWSIAIILPVMNELDGLKHSKVHGRGVKSQSGSSKLLELLGHIGQDRFNVLEENATSGPADGQFFKYMTKKNDVLFTSDKNLIIILQGGKKKNAHKPVELTAQEAADMCKLGWCYQEGIGTPRDTKKAKGWLSTAAKIDAGAMYLLYKLDNKQYQGMLRRAAENGNARAMLELGWNREAQENIRLEDINKPGCFGFDIRDVEALHYAVRIARTDIVDALLKRGFNGNFGALQLATELGYVEIARLLMNPYCAASGPRVLRAAIASNMPDVVEYTLCQGVDGNAVDYIGWAAELGRSEIVEILLRHGANPNQTYSIERSCLGEVTAELTPLAVALKNNHKETAALLKRYGGRK